MIVKDFSNSPSQANKSVLISGRNISHRFDYLLFEGLNIDIHKKESIAILGVSGSGKSTLLHILSTLLRPLKGEVSYGSDSFYHLDDKRQTDLRRDMIGIVFQSHYLFKGFSVRENLEISSLLSSNEIDMDLIERLNINDTMDQNVSDLSGGQQQRVSIARVLTKRPRVIFADEPTGNLDNATAVEIMDTMLQYIEDVAGALLIVTHDQEMASKCDSIYKLEDKKLKKIFL
jgi:putative ABC transport system ATP-binding protein